MAPVDLHALPFGSVIAAGQTVAIRTARGSVGGGLPRPWYLTDPPHGPYTVGDLLAMSQDWVVLRHGPSTVVGDQAEVADEYDRDPDDEPGGDDPEAPGVQDLGQAWTERHR
jgi:hypothetical protein